jgi:hypothetical protein
MVRAVTYRPTSSVGSIASGQILSGLLFRDAMGQRKGPIDLTIEIGATVSPFWVFTQRIHDRAD